MSREYDYPDDTPTLRQAIEAACPAAEPTSPAPQEQK